MLKCCSSVITCLSFTFSYRFNQFNLLLSVTEAQLPSVGLQDRLERLSQDLVADLGVGNGPVLLAQVKAQLALVAEVKVTLFALVKHEGQKVKLMMPQGRMNATAVRNARNSRCKVSLRCECAGGSSGFADGGSECHRCGRGRASRPCGSGCGLWGEQPATRTNPVDDTFSLLSVSNTWASNYCPPHLASVCLANLLTWTNRAPQVSQR